jgi:hydroxymethylpyrimidine pyrophosphatase-like HAD family hydrolase
MTHADPHKDTRRFDAVVCDIDGCLCGEDGSPFDLASLATIRNHNELSIKHNDRPTITVCTGRPVGFAEAMTRLIGNSVLPAIAEMGVYLHHPESAQSEVDPAIDSGHMKSIAGLENHFHEVLRPSGVTMQPGKSASVTFWHKDTEHLRQHIYPGVQELCEQHNWPVRVSMSWFYINCDLTHISKGTGIERFKSHTGYTSNRLVGIGDTSSDLEIRKQVGFFACPANAHDDVKAVADFVANKPEAEGVIEILQHISAM